MNSIKKTGLVIATLFSLLPAFALASSITPATPATSTLPLSSWSVNLNNTGATYDNFYYYNSSGAGQANNTGVTNQVPGTYPLSTFGQVSTSLIPGQYTGLVYTLSLPTSVYTGWDAVCGVGGSLSACETYLGTTDTFSFTVASGGGSSSSTFPTSTYDSNCLTQTIASGTLTKCDDPLKTETGWLETFIFTVFLAWFGYWFLKYKK